MNHKKITLDTERKSFESIIAMQGDNKSRYIDATIVNRSIPVDLTGCTVKFSAIKPDLTDIFNDAVIIDAKGGKVQIELTNQTLAKEGVIQATLVILKEDMQLSVLPFFITVIENPYNPNAIESKPEYQALNNALIVADGYAKELQDASVNLEEKYTTRLNNFGSQLDKNVYELNDKILSVDNKKLNKDGIVHMPNIGQDIKEVWTSGQVAVVGIGSTGIENLRDDIAFKIGKYININEDYTINNGYYQWNIKQFINDDSNNKYVIIPCGHGDRFRLTGYSSGEESLKRFMCARDNNGDIVFKTGNYQINNFEYVVEKNVVDIVINFDISKEYLFEKVKAKNIAEKDDIEVVNDNINILNNVLSTFDVLDIKWQNGYYNFQTNSFNSDNIRVCCEIACKKGDRFLISGYVGGNSDILKTAYEVSGNAVKSNPLSGQTQYNDYIYEIIGNDTVIARMTFNKANYHNVKIYKLINNISDVLSIKSSKYKGKILTTYGDSWVANGNWQDYLVDYFEFAQHNNCGVGGYRVTNGDDGKTLCTKDGYAMNRIPSNTEVLIIVCSTNDWLQNTPLGENSPNNFNDKTFIGAVNTMFKNLCEKLPNAEIICFGNGFGYSTDGRTNFINNLTNQHDLYNVDYGNIMGNLGRRYGIKYIPVGEGCGFNVSNKDLYYHNEEGAFIHMNDDGAKKYAMRSIDLLK